MHATPLPCPCHLLLPFPLADEDAADRAATFTSPHSRCYICFVVLFRYPLQKSETLVQRAPLRAAVSDRGGTN